MAIKMRLNNTVPSKAERRLVRTSRQKPSVRLSSPGAMRIFVLAAISVGLCLAALPTCMHEPRPEASTLIEDDRLWNTPEHVEAFIRGSAANRRLIVAPLLGPDTAPYYYECTISLTQCKKRTFKLDSSLANKRLSVQGIATWENEETFLALLEHRGDDFLDLYLYICHSGDACEHIAAQAQLQHRIWFTVETQLFIDYQNRIVSARLPFGFVNGTANKPIAGFLRCNPDSHSCQVATAPPAIRWWGPQRQQPDTGTFLVLSANGDDKGRPFLHSCEMGRSECRQRVLSQYEVNWQTKAGALADYGTHGGLLVVAAPETDSRPRLFLCETDDPEEPCRSAKVAFGGDDDWAPVMSNRQQRYDIAIDEMENTAYILAGTHVDSLWPVILKCDLGSLDCSGVILKKLPRLTGRFAKLVLDQENRRLIIATVFADMNQRLQMGVFAYDLGDFR